MKCRSTLAPAAAFVLTAVSLLPAAAIGAPTPILEYKFNGGSLASTGSVTTSLTLENSALVGGAGTGLSGSVGGDNALDLSANTGMGSAGSATAPGALISSRPVEVNVLKSFTIQGWFKTDGSLVNGNANLFTVNGNMVVSGTASGQLSLNVDGTSKQSASGGYNTNSVWTFFAVTYDGTLTGASANNVKFYVGNASTAVSQLGTTITLDSATVSSTSAALVIGNSVGQNRGFDGLLDNIRFFGATSGAGGVLTLGELEALRSADITAIPEPSTYAATLAGLAGIAACVRRRSRKAGARS